MRLYFMQGGTLYGTKNFFVAGAPATEFNVPVPFFLIQYKGKNILFDTGLHEGDMTGHLLSRITDVLLSHFEDDGLAVPALQKLGIEPEDIDIIILSHLHYDHAGAVTKFPNATVIVQRSEFDYVRRPDYFMNHVYYNDEAPAAVTGFDGKGTDAEKLSNVDWFFLDGWQDNRFDLFRDGRLVIYFTPGHTVGHQSLYVRTDEDGEFLLTADASYVEENIDKVILPGLVLDCASYLQNLRLFRLMKKTGVTLVSGHDPEGWKKFKKAPDYYR